MNIKLAIDTPSLSNKKVLVVNSVQLNKGDEFGLKQFQAKSQLRENLFAMVTQTIKNVDVFPPNSSCRQLYVSIRTLFI